MARHLTRGLLLTAIAFALVSAPLLAQAPGTGARAWRVAAWVKGGYQQPGGVFAQSQPSELQELQNYLSEFRVDPSSLVGAGVEVRFPRLSMGVRLGWEQTAVADATGRLGICHVLRGPICEPQVAPAQFQAITGDFRFSMRRPSDRIRPLLLAGGAVRQAAFEAPTCDLSADDPLICQTIVLLYDEPVPHAYLRLGLGLEATAGPALLNAVASMGTGRYGTGRDRVNGQWYNEIRFEVSAGYVVY